jgi:hypothetical protein
MADRIEYEGVPLPSGLPGFGGGTVEVLVLPGFNTVVAPLQFGPVVDAINANPPDPTPPSGSNPDDPTDEVVDPGPPPTGPGGGTDPRFDSLCNNYDCNSDPELGQPFVYAQKLQDPVCTACNKPSAGKYYPNFFSASSDNTGFYYVNTDHIRGKAAGSTWDVDIDGFRSDKATARLELGPSFSSNGAKLDKDKLIISGTEYRKNAKIYDIDNGRTYEPQALEVCEGGQTKTWYVLAYKE